MIAAQELRLNNLVNTEHGIGRVTSLELHTPLGFEIGVTVPPLEKYVYKNPKVTGIPPIRNCIGENTRVCERIDREECARGRGLLHVRTF